MKKIITQLHYVLLINRNFGIKYALQYFMNKFVFRNERLFGKYKECYYSSVRKYISDNYYSDDIGTTNKSMGKIKSDCPIWTMWWQGKEDIPEIVECCINSIYSNKGEHELVVLDKYNYINYVSLPESIIDKFNAGKIPIAQLVDMIRIELLYKYGGIWMDATLYLEHQFDNIIYEYDFFSIKHGKSLYLSDGAWSTFFLACGINNYIIGEIRKVFLNYWLHENCPIDYFIFDCIIKIIYDNDVVAKEKIDSIPFNNEDVFYMNNMLNKNADKYIKNEGTYINKLSWKEKHCLYDGKNESLYKKILYI